MAVEWPPRPPRRPITGRSGADKTGSSLPTAVAVLARIGASCADDGTAVFRSLVPNFPFVETNPVVRAEASGAQSRIVEAQQLHPTAVTGPVLSFATGVAPPALLLAAGAFWQRADQATLTGSGLGGGQ